MRGEASEAQWRDYISLIQQQMALVDQLNPENRRLIWEYGFDAVAVRRMLAAQRKAARTKEK